MICKFTYDELNSIAACLKLIRAVYGRDNLDDLIKRVDDLIAYMDTAPITEIYDIK